MVRIWARNPQILGLIPAVDLQAEYAAVHGILARTRSRTETLHLLLGSSDSDGKSSRGAQRALA